MPRLIRRLLLSTLLVSWISIRAFADEPPFTQQANVVIMAGLPGDIESERRFEEETRQLLEFLSLKESHPKSVHVLIDNPAAIPLPAGLAGDVKAATRENFLALAKIPAIDTDPLVVFAWGHAGLQKTTPVFHVRGPRITPVDFSTFAASVSKIPSRWVLLFRGSGSFAKAIRSPQAAVISSEFETAFNSDPVGIDLLTGILRAHAGTDFSKLAGMLGEKTTAWYDDNHLARQEEPTLWSGSDEPRLLAKSSSPAPSPGDAPPETPASTPPGKAGSAPSAEWSEITPVDPAKYPNDDAVVLRRSVHYVLGEDPAISLDHDEFIQILNGNGKQYGDFDIAYSPPDETITFLDCEVKQPGGDFDRLDAEEIRDAQSNGAGDYKTPRRKIFSLPNVKPGVILHVRYRTAWKRFPLPHTFLEIPLAKSIPIADLRVEVRVSGKSAFHFAFDNSDRRDPRVSQTSYGSAYAWEFTDVPPMVEELLTPPHRQPALLVSTFPDWEAFAGWYGRLIRDADKITPEITARAAEVVGDGKDARQKIAALYNFVTNLRYVAVPLGVNSYRPHAAANVLKNNYGDCKDKANLFNTMLRSQGIDANLVLVPRFSQAHEDTPGLAFNHAISQIHLGKEIIWADTTDGICRFGLLPPGDTGRKVLVVDGKTTTLTTLPAPAPDQHRLTIKNTITIASASGPSGCTFEAQASGYPDYQLREAVLQARGYKTTEPVLAMQYHTVCGLLEMTDQSHSSVSSLDEMFAWNATGRWSGLITPTPDAARSILRAPFWLPSEWESALHSRKSALFLNQGYPLKLDQQIDFSIPGGSSSELPKLQKSETGPLRWQIEWSKPVASIISARVRIELVAGELDMDQTRVFQKQLDTLYSALSQPAFLTLH